MSAMIHCGRVAGVGESPVGLYRIHVLIPIIGIAGIICTILLVMRAMESLATGVHLEARAADVFRYDILPTTVALGGPSLMLLWMVRLRAVLSESEIVYRGFFRSIRIPWSSIFEVHSRAKALAFRVRTKDKWVDFVNLVGRGGELNRAVSDALRRFGDSSTTRGAAHDT